MRWGAGVRAPQPKRLPSTASADPRDPPGSGRRGRTARKPSHTPQTVRSRDWCGSVRTGEPRTTLGARSASTTIVREFRLEGAEQEGVSMGKVIECNQVVPDAGCDHVVRGATEQEALRNAAEHAKEHGIVEVTPELMEKVTAAMHDE